MESAYRLSRTRSRYLTIFREGVGPIRRFYFTARLFPPHALCPYQRDYGCCSCRLRRSRASFVCTTHPGNTEPAARRSFPQRLPVYLRANYRWFLALYNGPYRFMLIWSACGGRITDADGGRLILLAVSNTCLIYWKHVHCLQPLHSRYGNKPVLYPMQGAAGLSPDFLRCDLRQCWCMRQLMDTTPYEVGTRLSGARIRVRSLPQLGSTIIPVTPHVPVPSRGRRGRRARKSPPRRSPRRRSSPARIPTTTGALPSSSPRRPRSAPGC